MFKLPYLIFVLLFCPSLFAVQVGEAVPVCNASLKTPAQKLDLTKYRNKVLFVDFWATWCPPCKQSMPFLNALRNELNEKGFEIIAINVDEDFQDAVEFLQQFPVDYPVAYDSLVDCPAKYDVKAMPSSYFIDRQGKVRFVHLGFRRADESEIRARVLSLLEEKR